MSRYLLNLANKIAADLSAVQLQFSFLLGMIEGAECVAPSPIGATEQSRRCSQVEDKGILNLTQKEDLELPNIMDNVIYFTRNELKRIVRPFQREFIEQGACAHIRCRNDLRYAGSYEIRYRKHGVNASGSGTTIPGAVATFLKNLNAAFLARENAARGARPVQAPNRAPAAPSAPSLNFDEFMRFYFKEYRVRKVVPLTYSNDVSRCKNHVLPAFGKMSISEVTTEQLQHFFDDKAANVGMKTAKEALSLISGMYRYAHLKGLIDVNPCSLVITEDYECEHGAALTFQEEDRLIASLRNNPKYLIPLAVALYAGLRPCEYSSATVEGDFIKARNRKRKTKKVVFKYIPIIPRLRAILGETKELYFPDKKYLSQKLKEACPSHKLYDLRTTFDSRCEYFKVADFARAKWMGHGIDKLRNAYGDLPPEWFLKEAEKLNY